MHDVISSVHFARHADQHHEKLFLKLELNEKLKTKSKAKTNLSAWPLRTMLGPLPISVPVPPMLAAYDTEIFRAQANKRNSLSSLAYISAHIVSSISFRGTASSLLQQK